MSANQACFPIAIMARVPGVSKAGYHAWIHRPPSAQAVADGVLLKLVRTVHAPRVRRVEPHACMPICRPEASGIAASGSRG